MDARFTSANMPSQNPDENSKMTHPLLGISSAVRGVSGGSHGTPFRNVGLNYGQLFIHGDAA